MLGKLIRIEKSTEKPAYVNDKITGEVRPVIGNEFEGTDITQYSISLFGGYLQINVFSYPIDGEFDKVIPWFWTTKEAIPRKYAGK